MDKFGPHPPIWTDIGRSCPDARPGAAGCDKRIMLPESLAIIGQNWPIFSEIGRKSAQISQIRPQLGPGWQALAKWSNMVKVGQIRANFHRVWQELANILPSSAKFEQMLADDRKIGQQLVKSGLPGQLFDNSSTTYGQLRRSVFPRLSAYAKRLSILKALQADPLTKCTRHEMRLYGPEVGPTRSLLTMSNRPPHAVLHVCPVLLVCVCVWKTTYNTIE